MGHPAGTLSPPLAGIRVVEVANYVTGPYAAVLLAELGADVVKIEEPERGDPFRGWGDDGYSPTFRSVNRGKRSIGVDLGSAEGRELALELAGGADVVVENFRPGVAERLGIGYEAVRARNAHVVYCSISGFGTAGPHRDRPGYDTVGQAMSGLLSLLTDLDQPQVMGISLADHLTGLSASHGILAALVGRGVSGAGRRIETSLLQATAAFLAENAARYLDDGRVPTRMTRARIAQAFAFVGADRQPFVVHLSSPQKFWNGLVDAVGAPELREDPRFVDRKARVENYDELERLLADRFATRRRAEWLERLAAADVPAGPINRLDEVFEGDGLGWLELVRTVEHPTWGPMRLLRGPLTVDGLDESSIRPPPLLGEHSDEILRELGRDVAAIAALRERRVVR